MLGLVSKDNLHEEMEKLFSVIDGLNIDELLRSISQTYPDSWDEDHAATDYILRFLTSEARLQEIRKQVTDYIKYLREKS